MYPPTTSGVIQDAGRIACGLPLHVATPGTNLYYHVPVILDLETTNREFGHARNPNNRIVSAAWRVGESGETHYKAGGEFEQRALVKDINACQFIVAHNAKFELQWLARMGVRTETLLVYDTMLGEYVLAGNRQWPLDLGAVSIRYGGTGKEGIIDALMKGGVCPSEMPEHLLKARVIKDVEDTARIFYQQRDRLKKDGLLPVLYTRCLFTPVIADIEMQETHLSSTHVAAATLNARNEEAVLSAEFSKMTGGINARSTKQMAEYVYGAPPNGLGFEELRQRGIPLRNKPSAAFPEGAPKVDTSTLDALVAKTEEQRAFITLRKKLGKVQARLSKTLEFFSGVVQHKGGKFSGQINQAVTQTHRTSSSGVPVTGPDGTVRRVQFQNFPNEFKGLIMASAPGRVIAEIDGMQLEFRGAAELSRDQQAIEDIRNDEDIHRFTASVLNKIDEEKVTKDQRKKAKAHTFKPLYGGMSGTKDQVRYYEAFREKYKTLYETQKAWCFKVLKEGFLRVASGLKFYFPGTRISDSGYISNTPSIFNYPVQSFCTAEIIPVAISYLWHRIKAAGLDWRLINTVHDSAVLDIPGDAANLEELKKIGIQSFTLDVYFYLKAIYNIDMEVPLGAGFSVGPRWQSDLTHEDEINVERNGNFWKKA